MTTRSISVSRDGGIVKTKFIEEEVTDIKNLIVEIDGLSQHKMPGDKELLEWARRAWSLNHTAVHSLLTLTR